MNRGTKCQPRTELWDAALPRSLAKSQAVSGFSWKVNSEHPAFGRGPSQKVILNPGRSSTPSSVPKEGQSIKEKWEKNLNKDYKIWATLLYEDN
jgi:hypothetical protein